MQLKRTTEVRKLPAAEIHNLAQILNQSHSWKKLMQGVPKYLKNGEELGESVCKYNSNDIKLIENASHPNRLAAEILFEEWGTSGKVRPTLSHLLQLLVKIELFRAADYVAVNILKEQPPERPQKGPAAKVNINLPLDDEDINDMLSEMSDPRSSDLLMNNSGVNNNDNFDERKEQNYVRKVNYAIDLVEHSSNNDHSSLNSSRDLIPNFTGLLENDSTSNNTSYLYSDSSMSSASNSNILLPAFSKLNLQSSSIILPNLTELNLTSESNVFPNLSELHQFNDCNGTSENREIINQSDLIPNISELHYVPEVNNLASTNSINTKHRVSFNIPMFSKFDEYSSRVDNIEISGECIPNISMLGLNSSSNNPVGSSDSSEQTTNSNADIIPCLSMLQK